MQITDWNERWKKQQIGFHLEQVNDCLTAFIEHFNLPQNATVFVPLCGKSNDLFWLAEQGYRVIGNECSPLAVSSFFKHYDLKPSIKKINHFNVYQSDNIIIYQGDFFKLNPTHFAQCDLIYDRASLVSFSEQQRGRYIEHLNPWFLAKTQLFLVTLSYDQKIMNGPPFSVSRQEVERHYRDKNIQQIRQLDIIDEGPRWRKAGLTSLMETAFKINQSK